MGNVIRLTVVAALLASGAARAQVAWPARVRPPGLTSADIKALEDATAGLYQSDATPVGKMETWSNPATGNAGSASLARQMEIRGMKCRNVVYNFDLTRPARRSTYSINWCLTPQNGWKIAG